MIAKLSPTLYKYSPPSDSSTFYPSPIRQHTALLLGYGGTGKSTLMNTLCDTKQETGISMNSKTKELFKAQCQYIKGFYVIDTPSLALKDRNAKELRKILKKQEYDTIIVMAKFEPRFEDQVLEKLRGIELLFGHREVNVLFMVSFIDRIPPDELDRTLKLIEQSCSAKCYHFKQPIILFSNNSADGELLAKTIFDSLEFRCEVNRSRSSFESQTSSSSEKPLAQQLIPDKSFCAKLCECLSKTKDKICSFLS